MNTKMVAGLFLAGVGIYALTKMASGSNTSRTLVQRYLAEIAAATTYAELDAIRYRFEADYSYGGLLNYEQYSTLYNAYAQRYGTIEP